MFKSISRGDIFASLVVFIVAVPLSLGIALASGASPATGLITGIIGGIFAGFLAGAPLSVTGPAAGMSALVFQLVQQHGLKGLAIITVFAGVLQMMFGLFKTGKLFSLIPKAVLEGVLTAIGMIIVVGQLHVLTGQGIPKSFYEGLIELPSSFTNIGPILFCGLLAIAIQIIWKNKMKKLSWLPGALPAVVCVTLLSLQWQMPRVELAPIIPMIQESAQRFLSLTWLQTSWPYFLPAIGVAIVASAESLLTARAVDVLVQDRKNFKPANLDKELFAQGAANMASGFLGGLPMTAVMVRSAANIDSGATTRWSTILHGVWIAAFIGFLPGVIKAVPLTALAAVLIVTGYKLLNLPTLIKEIKTHWQQGFLWLSTTVLILVTDLLVGLIASLVLATVMHYSGIIISRYQKEKSRALAS